MAVFLTKRSKQVTDQGSKKLRPLYIQIGELLHREIVAGHWLPGERLPVEASLADTLGVAVGTLRKALARLEEDGLVERRQGSGTYIKRASGGRAVYQFFHLELRYGGGVPSTTPLSLSIDHDPTVLRQLQISDTSQPLWRIHRARYLNRLLVAVEQTWFRHAHAPTLKLTDLHESLYRHYRENFSFWISRVEDEIDCALAPDWVIEKLELETQQITPRVQRRSWSNQDQIEEFSVTWYDPAKCRYFARWQ